MKVSNLGFWYLLNGLMFYCVLLCFIQHGVTKEINGTNIKWVLNCFLLSGHYTYIFISRNNSNGKKL